MKYLWRTLGIVWALPITTFGLLYATIATLLGFYKYLGIGDGLALVFVVKTDAPSVVRHFWKWLNQLGHAIGNVVVFRDVEYTLQTYDHEIMHVKQTMVLGVLQPLTYFLNYFTGYILQKTLGGVDGYWDNIFEIHCRRTAHQIIDVVGEIQKHEKH